MENDHCDSSDVELLAKSISLATLTRRVEALDDMDRTYSLCVDYPIAFFHS